MNRDNDRYDAPPLLDQDVIEQVSSLLKHTFGGTADLELIPLRICEREGLLCYLSTMTSSSFMMDNIIKPLIQAGAEDSPIQLDGGLEMLGKHYMSGLPNLLLDQIDELPRLISSGFAAIAVDGASHVLLVEVINLDTRAVAEPTTQNVVRGPKEGFTESAATNMSLIRRRIPNEDLRFEKFVIGSKTRTAVYLAYIDHAMEPHILQHVRDKLSSCKLDSLFDSGGLEGLFRPTGLILFPAAYNSERPDMVCAFLLDKKIGIIVNGSPFVLILPAVMSDFFKSPEDRYQWRVFSDFVRFVRYIAFFFSLCMPALYVAVTSYHQELIPTTLLTSIAAQREGIPFPAVIEIFLMEITFEILREASTRMPRIVGNSISIAGALVLGEAAVQAGIVSNINVIVVSLAVISGYVAPVYAFGSNIRLYRYALIIAAAVVGLYGVILGCAFLMIHLARLEILGVPYLPLYTKSAGRRSS